MVINIRIISATTITRDIRIISVRVMGVIILTSVINLMLIYTLIRIITFIRRNNKCKIRLKPILEI